MENIEPKETGEWGMGRWGDEEDEEDEGEKISNPECPMTAVAPLGETPRPHCLPNDGSCSTWGDPKTALPPPCPMPKTQLLLYLIPIIGFFPSLWTLYRRRGSREQLAISRLSIALALTWLLGYLLLATGAATSDFFTLRLFILNSFLTSSYFLVSVWLIFRLIQGKSGRLPGFTTLAERVIGKYLS